MIKPNFLIVGAAKSGTTSLYYYLKQHPDIYMSEEVKEPHYFARETFSAVANNTPMAKHSLQYLVQDKEKYSALFAKAICEKAVGEASTGYLYAHKEAIQKIKTELGDIKIIIMLRNPIQRAFSAYSHLVKDCFEVLTFKEALHAEEKRKEEGWHPFFYYKSYGLYSEMIKAYLENFSDVKIVFFENFNDNEKNVVKDIYEFLGVDSSFTPNTGIKLNVTGIPKSRLLYNFMMQENLIKRILRPVYYTFMSKHIRKKVGNIMMQKNLQKMNIFEKDRIHLQQFFKDDIKKIEKLLNMDLSHWH